MDLNKVMIIGRLTRDPEVRTTPSGQSVCSFGVATNRVWTDQAGQKQEKVEFHNIVAWRRLAEICGQYLQKGRQVYIEGRLQTRDWIGQDGNKRQRTEIITENMIMLGSPGSYVGGAPAKKQNNVTPPQEVGSSSNAPSANNEEEIKVEDIPF